MLLFPLIPEYPDIHAICLFYYKDIKLKGILFHHAYPTHPICLPISIQEPQISFFSFLQTSYQNLITLFSAY